jgi:hypothetical protein
MSSFSPSHLSTSENRAVVPHPRDRFGTHLFLFDVIRGDEYVPRDKPVAKEHGNI